MLTSSNFSVGDRSSLFTHSSVPLQQRSSLMSNVPSLTSTPRHSSSIQSRYITPIISVPYSQTVPIISVPYSQTVPIISHTISTESTLIRDTVYFSSLLQQTYSVTKQTTFSTQITSPSSYATSSTPSTFTDTIFIHATNNNKTNNTNNINNNNVFTKSRCYYLFTYTPVAKFTSTLSTDIPFSSLLTDIASS